MMVKHGGGAWGCLSCTSCIDGKDSGKDIAAEGGTWSRETPRGMELVEI